MQPSLLLEQPARESLRQAAAALDEAELLGQPLQMSQALVALARAYTALRAGASAEACLASAWRWACASGCTDHAVDVLCALCEAAARLAAAQDAERPASGRAARERARDHAFEASTQAAHVSDPAWEAKVLLRISDVLHHCGDHDDAAMLQTRALRLMAGGGLNPAWLPGLGRLADR